MLGFAGVILALAPIALKLPNDVQVNAGLVITASVMFGALLLCVAFCLSVLAPQKVILPAVSHSREAWRMYLTEKRTGKANRDLAEALFRGSTLTQPSPLDLALHDASVRGTRFRWSVWCLAISIGALAATVAQLSWQMVR
ncbi:MAG TPA: hypothetical protein VFQ85_14525 [Mycobacteriales bacterium]|nr:hypothetical protein [Mycobacteriales bacterium]